MIETNWCVITGGPSSGKTTLINYLANQGYQIAPEVARSYIKKLLGQNNTLDEIYHNTEALQRGILANALKRERKLKPEQLIFFDRGTLDTVGYLHHYQIESPQVRASCQQKRYKKIFYCHPLPLFKDDVRIEDTQAAEQISAHIYQTYHAAGYELIELPVLPVDLRAHIVLQHS